MKTIKYALSIVLAIVLLAFSSCKNGSSDPTPSEIEKRLTDLQNGGSNWVLGSVSKDGYDVTDQFTGFKLTIGEYTYTTINSLSPVWEASGTWAFQNDDPNMVVRGDGVVIAVVLGNNTLDLTFNAQGSSGGRIDSVAGEYQFHLVGE
ncbi:MAG: hypothetical protein OEY51_00425 [Cyclobacteriaceae bacterium]|nr:hypothetical protein [Cyclobacteriaceae bacterium]